MVKQIMLFVDRKFRLPRIWSNNELKKFAPLFEGDIVNVSGWQDKDKEGDEYKNYFKNKKSYTITNYKTEAMGFQGMEGEIFLDLEKELPDELAGKFDVVFNHTVLEHIFEIEQAFKNLCLLSKDIVVLVMPFLQQMHADYGDYWRMTPLAIDKLFIKNGYKLLYLSFNDHASGSVYIFSIASKQPDKWLEKLPVNVQQFSNVKTYDGYTNYAGSNAIGNILYSIKLQIIRFFTK